MLRAVSSSSHKAKAALYRPLLASGGYRTFKVPSMNVSEVKDFGVFKVYTDSDFFAWMVMDRPGKSENAIGADFQPSIHAAADYLELMAAQGKIKACIVTSAKKRFCVGADVTEFYQTTDIEDIRKRLKDGRTALRRLSDLSVPTIAAINGDALGGGLEIALACNYRVAAASPKHNLGLPEIMLGVLPGLGGTVRFPKLVGLQAGLANVLAGKSLKAKKAKSLGLVDALVEDEDRFPGENRFMSGARQYAGKVFDKKAKPKKESWMDWFLTHTPVGRYVVADQTVKKLNKETKGKYPAPFLAFESIMNATKEKDVHKAMEFESEKFAQLCVSPQAKSMMSLFFLQDRCKKLETQAAHFKPEDAVPVTKIGVVGAGVMGSGIAHWSVNKKQNVVMKDITEDAVKKGMDFIEGEFKKALKKKRMDKLGFEETMTRCMGTTSTDPLKECNVIIEAAVEVMDIKKKMLQEFEQAGVVDDKTIFATNTSALSITELATASKYPQNVVGMHFFNPVSRMPLVEVIKGAQSSPQAVATVYKLALDMGKFPVVVGDGPGFLVNRVLGIYMSEAGRMLNEGADPKQLDKLILDFGMPMGPIRLLDEVGIDVAEHVGPTLKGGLGTRFTINENLSKMVKAGFLGKKNGKAFYKYNEKGKETGIDVEGLKSCGVYHVNEKFDYSDATERCMLSMVNEAVLILEEGIAESPEDVDLGMVFGTGFAPFRGGLMSYCDNMGIPEVVAALNALNTKYPEEQRFKPAATLVKMAEKGERWFPDRPLVKHVDTKPVPKVSYF